MKKQFLKTLTVTTSFIGSSVILPAQIFAAGITNPAIGSLGDSSTKAESGSTFTGYFVTIWRALIFVGVLALLFNLLNGGLDWILAGGEAAKIQKGRDKMVQSVIGMVILAGSFVIISYVSSLLFNFDLLNLTVPTVGSAGPTGTP